MENYQTPIAEGQRTCTILVKHHAASKGKTPAEARGIGYKVHKQVESTRTRNAVKGPADNRTAGNNVLPVSSVPALALLGYGTLLTIQDSMTTGKGMCTIKFNDPAEKAKAFFELVHSKTSFSGMGKDIIVIKDDDCAYLESKDIKFQHLD